MVTNEDKYKVNNFVTGPEEEANREESAKLTKAIHNEFKDLFSGIGCFEGTFSLQVEEEANHIRHPVMHGICAI